MIVLGNIAIGALCGIIASSLLWPEEFDYKAVLGCLIGSCIAYSVISIFVG